MENSARVITCAGRRWKTPLAGLCARGGQRPLMVIAIITGEGADGAL